MGETGLGLGNGEGDRISGDVVDGGVGRTVRPCEVTGEGEIVLKGKREGVFEFRKKVVEEGGWRVRVLVEEKALKRWESQPSYVEESDSGRDMGVAAEDGGSTVQTSTTFTSSSAMTRIYMSAVLFQAIYIYIYSCIEPPFYRPRTIQR